MPRNKGHSLTAWVITFTVIVAVVLFIRAPIKNGLQAKITGATDYMLWKKYGQDVDQYKGDDTSFVKTKTEQNSTVRQTEREGRVGNDTTSVSEEDTVSSGVEEGSQPALKTVNLNDLLP